MELMPACLFSIILGFMCAAPAAVASPEMKTVKVGEPVTLHCALEEGNKEHVDSSELEWRTAGQTAVKFVNGNLMSECGFEGRVKISENFKKGNFSFTISSTQFSDYGVYECRFKRKHLKTWTLRIKAEIPEERTVIVGLPAWIPCYGRVKRCLVDKSSILDKIAFHWSKKQQRVLSIEKGSIKNPSVRLGVSHADMQKGNFSLVFDKTYFSDHGTYICSEQQSGTILKVQACTKNYPVSLEEYLSLPLYTTDPFELYFQKNNFSERVPLSPRWTLKNNTLTMDLIPYIIDLESVTMEDLGMYTVVDSITRTLICTFHVTSHSETLIQRSYVSILAAILVCIAICTALCYYLIKVGKKEIIKKGYQLLNVLVSYRRT